MRKQEMHEGRHTVIVREANGKEIERLTFDLHKLSPLDAVIHDRFFVYNVASQNVYRRAAHGYATRRENATYSEELIGMQRFFEQRDVDYAFQNALETISIDSGSSSATKVSFNVAKDVDLKRFALIRMEQGKPDDAKKAIEFAVTNVPCDTTTRRTQVYLASAIASPEAGADAAHHWIADCAQDDLEAHRAYQDVNKENGREQALRDEYRKMLSASPDSGKAHNLFGRVAGDLTTATAEYEQAVRLDPKLIWPRVALGRAYLLMERYDDAMREFATAADMEGRDPAVVIYYANAAIAKGSPADAIAKIDEIRKTKPRDSGASQARWLLALATGDWPTATDIEKGLAAQESPGSLWYRNTKVLRLQGDTAVDAKIDGALRSRDLHAVALQVKAERLLETGDYAGCAEFVAKNAKEIDPASSAMLLAYSGAGLIIEGKAEEGDNVLAQAKNAIGNSDKGSGDRLAIAVIDGLRGTIPVDATMRAAQEADAVTHGWFVAGVRAWEAGDRDKARADLEKCARLAADLDFPYLEARAMAGRVHR
jgi:tetratricopeptide (TPR) repeat protein